MSVEQTAALTVVLTVENSVGEMVGSMGASWVGSKDCMRAAMTVVPTAAKWAGK